MFQSEQNTEVAIHKKRGEEREEIKKKSGGEKSVIAVEELEESTPKPVQLCL